MTTNLFSGIFRLYSPSAGNGDQITTNKAPMQDYLATFASWYDFETEWSNRSATGWQLLSIASSPDGSFYGLWRPGPVGAGLTRTTDLTRFMADHNRFQTNGKVLRDMEIRVIGSETWYFGTWITPKGWPQQLKTGLTLDDLNSQVSSMASSGGSGSVHGLYMENVQAYETPTGTQYAAMFSEIGSTDPGHAFVSANDFDSFNVQAPQDSTSPAILDYQVYDDSLGNRIYIAALLGNQPDVHAHFVTNCTWSDFQQHVTTEKVIGYQLERIMTYPQKST